MENKTLIGLFALLAVLFNVIFYCNNWSLEYLGQPWGQSDYLRYEEFIKGEVINHVFTSKIIGAVGWVWFPPLLFGLALPLCLYFFFSEFMGSYDKGLWVLVWFVFGSSNILGYWFMGLLAQSVGMCFFLLCLGCGIVAWRDKLQFCWALAALFLGLSVLSHIVFCFIFVLLLYVIFVYFDMVFYAFLIPLIGLPIISRYNLHHFITPFSNYPLPEPTTYMLLFVFIFPMFYVLAFFGVRGKFDKTLLLILMLTMPFVQIGRGLFFLCLVLVPLAYLGFEKLFVEHRRFVFVAITLFMLLWFGNYYSFQAHNMALERLLSGLSVKELYESFGIAPTMNINITLTH